MIVYYKVLKFPTYEWARVRTHGFHCSYGIGYVCNTNRTGAQTKRKHRRKLDICASIDVYNIEHA